MSRERQQAGVDAGERGSDFGRTIEQGEARKLEGRADAATDEAVVAERACGLPVAGRYDVERCGSGGVDRTESVNGKLRAGGIEDQELKRGAFGVVPTFVGIHAVPAAVFAGSEQVVNRTQRGAWSRMVEHFVCGDMHATKVTAFRMRREVEQVNELAGACMHGHGGVQ